MQSPDQTESNLFIHNKSKDKYSKNHSLCLLNTKEICSTAEKSSLEPSHFNSEFDLQISLLATPIDVRCSVTFRSHNILSHWDNPLLSPHFWTNFNLRLYILVLLRSFASRILFVLWCERVFQGWFFGFRKSVFKLFPLHFLAWFSLFQLPFNFVAIVFRSEKIVQYVSGLSIPII